MDTAGVIEDVVPVDVIRFHGHLCAGLVIGARVARAAVERLGAASAEDPLIAVAETDLCAVDAVQAMTGCTYGRRTLQCRDLGKDAFTFWRSRAVSGLRIHARGEEIAPRTPEIASLHARVQAQAATDAERKRFTELTRVRLQLLTTCPDEALLTFRDVPTSPPVRPLPAACERCSECGELTRVDRLRVDAPRAVCRACREPGPR